MQHLRLATLCSAVLLSVLLCPGQAQATCTLWDIPPKMSFVQSNDTSVDVDWKQSEGGYEGTARSAGVNGVVDGTVNGSGVKFTIHWFPHGLGQIVQDSIGVYTGAIGLQGRMTGYTHDAEHLETKASWWSTEVVQCLTHMDTPNNGNFPGRKPRPPVKLGRVQPLPGTDPVAPPTICEAAASARARNSPAAPSLEAQCAAETSKNLTAQPKLIEIIPQ